MKASLALVLSAAAAVVADNHIADTTGVAFDVAGVTYTPSNNVGAQKAVSDDVCTMKEMLSTNTFGEIKAFYASSGLQELAQTSYPGTAHFDLFKDYYGSSNFVDGFIMAALDGTDGFTDESARGEAIEKGAWDQLAIKAILAHLDTAKASSGATQLMHLDHAFGLYVGNMKCSPYARAQKRAANFDRYGADGETAATNVKFMEHLVAAQSQSKSGGNISSHIDACVAAIQTIYVQASLRYLFKLDNDAANGLAYAEHQGEGLAFWRVVAPYYHEEVAHVLVSNSYDVTSAPCGMSHYCTGLHVMMHNLPAGVTADAVGVLEGTDSVECVETKGADVKLTGQTYNVKSIVNPFMDLSLGVGMIKDLLDEGKIDEVNDVYTATGLQCIANVEGAALYNLYDSSQVELPWSDLFVDYYGTTSYIEDTIQDAIAGRNGWDTVEASKEGVEKGVMDAVLMKGISDFLQVAVMLAAQGHHDSALHAWDSAFAVYAGHSDGNTPYARAVKRAANYGTYASTGEPDALANEEVMMAMKAGQSAIVAGSTDIMPHAETAFYNLGVVYLQASLRYLHKIDTDLAENLPYSEHKGEGKAFWHVIAPLVASNDAAGAKSISAFYDLNTPPTAVSRHYYFCEGREILTKNMPDGMAVDKFFGELEKTGDIDCNAQPAPSSGGSPSGGSPSAPTAAKSDESSKDESSSSMMSAAVGLLGAVAAVLSL
mmetsp:Transcript_37957/g.45767  ORF Transcript_37957/g.45767 Transcript_37957/m.45767 type:complete len:714 (+) Transcript_37957:135-2276(+)|eukprot:CAMPEP_0197851332 /NCGR_PEP_ID=MMETSP1438-20131217/17839_1 /TAXON_ID=1461541 /ORGANISM="Pterosperma sp., Strain CCMP1384" /LENGTH=713 /DNA_ID=CAMNT_0043464903 /DNA_START=121 /DNA_END=2262 /DNA_ORIENTATION=+